MPYSTQDRATFIALLPHLGPEGHRDEIVEFVRDHWAESLEELGHHPGWDQVRAGLIRLLPDLLEGAARDQALTEARRVLEAYPADLEADDPTLLVARHPAWVGLCALQLAVTQGQPLHLAMDWAVELSSAGFAASSGKPTQRGEVLWAMAEQAEEVAWHPIARQLLGAATEGPFADPASAARVRLLLGLRLVEDGDARGAEVLAEVADDEAADARARIHSLWVLAHLARRRGRGQVAREHLQHALTLIDRDAEPEVAGRIHGALGDLDDRE